MSMEYVLSTLPGKRFLEVVIIGHGSLRNEQMGEICDLVELQNDLYSSLLRIETTDQNQTNLTDFDAILQDLFQLVELTRYLVWCIMLRTRRTAHMQIWIQLCDGFLLEVFAK